MRVEEVDVVVVGARCAGSATAITLARHGCGVVAVDRASFPSSTLSTHLLWPSGVAELDNLGALNRVHDLGAPRLTTAMAVGAGHTVASLFSAYDGADYALCVRRSGLDAALVDTARDVGVDVRERSRVTALVWDHDRVAGVRYSDGAGEEVEVRARLVVGADGRRSTIARLVGATAPYRQQPSGRSCYFAYWHDTRDDWRSIAAQWRAGPSLGTAFPCDDGLVLSLVQPPADRHVAAGELEPAYRQMVSELPGLAARLEGCTLAGRVYSARDIVSYFRRSSGPGWVLAGDAGHFKDPVTAQGIRDAMHYGRLLGESVAAVNNPRALDRALLDWEQRRERECIAVYQLTNRYARGEEMTPLEVELYRAAASDPALARALMETISRVRAPGDLLSTGDQIRLAVRALRTGAAATRAAFRDIWREINCTTVEWRERRTLLNGSPPPLVPGPPPADPAPSPM